MGSTIGASTQRPSTAMGLPQNMLGSFQLDSSEGFDELMYELGVNIVTRKIANNLWPQRDVREEEGEICIDTLTSFKNTKTKFKLGEAREEREFAEDGSTMTLRITIPAKPEIVCTRLY